MDPVAGSRAVYLPATAASKNRLRLVCRRSPRHAEDSPVHTSRARIAEGWAGDPDNRPRRCIGPPRVRGDGLVRGWSAWALAAAAYIEPARLRHVSSIAGGSYGTFGDNWAADHLSQSHALQVLLALRFKPAAFRVMYAVLGVPPSTFSTPFHQTAVLRPSTITTDRSCFNPIPSNT